MYPETLLFADAGPEGEDALAVLFGVAYDGTTSYRPGTRFGPDAIRQASWNFESHHMDLGVDLREARFADAGTLRDFGSSAAMVEAVEGLVREQVGAGRFPLALGGEHSLTPACVRPHGRPAFVVLDAHMDFRDAYLGDPNSHACQARRVTEHVGADRVLLVGIRSASREEAQEADDLGVRRVTAFEIHREGLVRVLEELEDLPGQVYLSLDADAIDPAYAPAVGNPEPFGLSPLQVKEVVAALAPRLVGFDLTEVSPPWDHGGTAALAARLVREVLAGLLRAGRI
jgi:agmatinase